MSTESPLITPATTDEPATTWVSPTGTATPVAAPAGTTAASTVAVPTMQEQPSGNPLTSATGPTPTKFCVQNLHLHYGDFEALKDVSMDISSNRVTALIGPSGCGKSTFLKTLNRMNDLVKGVQVTGSVRLDGADIFTAMDAIALRKRVGMVFQQPNPFPKSVFDNIAYGPRINGIRNRRELGEIVERSLRQAAIWDEVKDRLHRSALGLSGGQQQRLCIARALATEPEVILMDEPTSALDPISTAKIEELVTELARDYTIVIVTHNMQQAFRIADNTAFFLLGELVEYRDTGSLFASPQDSRTADYVHGRFS